MKHTAPIAALFAALTASAAQAGTVTQDFNYSFNESDLFPNFSFNGFDTQNGTRELTGVTLNAVVDLSMTVTVENYDTVAYAADSWNAEASHTILVSFFAPEGEGEGDIGLGTINAPFYGLGGIAMNNITGELSAGDGGFPFGNPGEITVTESFSGSVDSTVGTDPAFFDYFTSDEPLNGIVGAFTEFLIEQPNGFGINAFASAFNQSGTLSLTYHFNTVPAPSALGALGAFGLLSTRRRR